ncbi:hypothetical protein WR25_20541 [Diploscapter pachys]|uniref:Oxidoreductase n=1 Tax=Diploscapter pachys TaxID=2018661 RepID=A0A2A2K7G5_9BILA|nr:hypothetical protein WR25_20541 [Diploscapter pachys]
MRIASPPTRHSCFYGVDTPERAKLLAAKHDVGGMTDFIHADTLAFVSIDGLYKALGEEQRAAVGERWQALDVLVLNAGMLGTLAAVPAIDPKEFAQVLTLNVSAQVAMIQAFDAMLRKAPAAKVIGVTSSVGRNPRAYWGAYGASKAAFETLIGAYGDETSEISGIRTAILDPGATRTKMRARAYPGEAPESVKPPEVVAERIAALAIAGFPAGHRERVG